MALSFHDVLRALVRGDRSLDEGEALAAIDRHEAAQSTGPGAAPLVPDPPPAPAAQVLTDQEVLSGGQ